VLEQGREQWGTRVGFLMAAMGSAVGLGNIWRFPYMCYKYGGGAFLIPYFVALFVVGVPLMMLEFGLGHYMKSGFPHALGRIDRRFSWIGWWAVSFVMFGIVVYYSVVIAWCVCYLFKSFSLSWESAATPGVYFNHFVGNISPDTAGDPTPIRLTLSSFRMQVFIALAAIWGLNWLVCFKGIQRGIERANKIFMPLLLVLVGILVVWTCTQFDGAGKGLAYYFDFGAGVDNLANAEVWVAAFGQIFFTLSLGFGIMVAYASYLPDDSNIPTNAVITSLGNCAFSIFAGLAVFATIGHMASSTGVSVAELGQQKGLAGPGLVFVTYPEVLSDIPGGNWFGILFFGALVVAGLSSSISIVEAFASGASDRFKVRRTTIVTIICSTAFAMTVLFCFDCSLYILDIIDHFCNAYGLITVVLLECIIVGWIFTSQRLRAHLDDTPGLRFPAQTNVLMRLLISVVLALTWYGLWKAESGMETGGAGALIGIGLARLLTLGGVVLVWLDKHWLDFDIKIVIPALLIYLLDRAVGADIAGPYENYETWAIWTFGVGWLGGLLLVGVIIDFFFRRADDTTEQDEPAEPGEA
jgi:NSS family neurotransmitter:Na+ symporter